MRALNPSFFPEQVRVPPSDIRTVSHTSPNIGFVRLDLVSVHHVHYRRSCFIDPAAGRYYAVLLNDDFHRAHAAEIRIEAGTTRLVDIIHDKEIELADTDCVDGGSLGRLTLAPGEGAILGLRLQKRETVAASEEDVPRGQPQ